MLPSLVHLELRTGNLACACAYYGELFGWRAEVVGAPMTYVSLDLGGPIGGGVVERDTRHACWLPYVEVADVHDTAERARGLGAAILLEPREGPAGWRSIVATPAGGAVALWQPKP